MRLEFTDLEHSKMKALRSIEMSGSTYSAMTLEFQNTGMLDYNAVKTSKTLTNKCIVKQPDRSSNNLAQATTDWISITVFNPFQCHPAAMRGPFLQSRLPTTAVHEKCTNNYVLRKQPVNMTNSLVKEGSWADRWVSRVLPDKLAEIRWQTTHWRGVHFWLTRR
jgi:hypothetical protein